MNKTILAVMAVAAIGFTASCGNKTQQGEAVDSVAVVDSIVMSAVQKTIDALNNSIESGDASKLQAALENVKASEAKLLKENPKVAKKYVAKVQSFLKYKESNIRLQQALANGLIDFNEFKEMRSFLEEEYNKTFQTDNYLTNH